MKKFKRIIAVAAITGALLASSIPSAFAEEQPQPTELPPLETGEGFSPFKDANGTRYANAVYFMWINGIAQGKSETRFGVSEPLKRVDAAMIIGNYGIEGLNQNPKTAPFTDLPQRAVRTVSALYDAKIIQGKTATLFGSNDTIKRGEAAIILSRFLPVTFNKQADIKFTDVSDRYRWGVEKLVAYGIVHGKTETRFGTADPLTRGELALMIHAIFKADKPVPDPEPIPNPDPILDGELPSSHNGVTLKAKKEVYSLSTDTGASFVMNNNGSSEYTLGSPAILQKKSGDSWSEIKYSDDVAFPLWIQDLKPGEIINDGITFESFETELTAGEYRLVYGFGNKTDAFFLAAEFTITE